MLLVIKKYWKVMNDVNTQLRICTIPKKRRNVTRTCIVWNAMWYLKVLERKENQRFASVLYCRDEAVVDNGNLQHNRNNTFFKAWCLEE